MVDVYIALTESARDRFVQGGLPTERVVVKPNFLHPGPEPEESWEDTAMFVGPLSVEKGIDVLLAAWERLGDRRIATRSEAKAWPRTILLGEAPSTLCLLSL
jgi:hypothetical protein